MLHLQITCMVIASLGARVNPQSAPKPASSAPASQPTLRRGLVAAILAYLMLAVTAIVTGSNLLSAFCTLLLVSVVLGPSLRAGRIWAWLIWSLLATGLSLLAYGGRAQIALDSVPIAINLGLAALFGHTLFAGHTPLIARAIIAMEGRDRLAQPGVARYARALTIAWSMLLVTQAIVFTVLLTWVLPQAQAIGDDRPWTLAYLHFGGYLVPAAFLLLEYPFRRWHLRHLPHSSVVEFVQRLVRNWPDLLRDSEPADSVR